MHGMASGRERLGFLLFFGLAAFALTPAFAGVDMDGSDIRDPADPIASPKTYADTLGTGPVVNVVGDPTPSDRRAPPIVEPDAPVDAPGSDVRIDLD
jgi:hypothetical protein